MFPRYLLSSLFDNLLLMKAGQIVYLGPAESKAAQWTPGNLRDYFAAVGRPIAADQDVADVVGAPCGRLWAHAVGTVGLH